MGSNRQRPPSNDELRLAIVRCNEQLSAGDRSESVADYIRRLLKAHELELSKRLANVKD
jgi:hypothetical protein